MKQILLIILLGTGISITAQTLSLSLTTPYGKCSRVIGA